MSSLLRCPRCGASATVETAVVPTMGDAGRAVIGYDCPNGCRYDELHEEIDAALGIRHDLG